MNAETRTELDLVQPAQNYAPPVAAGQDQMIAMIEQIVLNPQLPMERLEKMLDMKDRMDAQAARRAFDNAIAGAKSEIKPIEKTKRVHFESRDTSKPATDYKHETLAGIAEQIDPILSKYGLSYRYRTKQEGTQVTVTCILSHREGHFEETSLTGGPDTSGSKNSYQQVGSAVTYLQRYTLKALLGLAAAQDDDGNGAEAKGPVETITGEQYEQIVLRLEKVKLAEQVILDAEKIPALGALSQRRFPHVMDQLAITAKKRGIEL